MYVSHDLALQSLSGSNSLIEVRSKSENPLYSNSFGARLGFSLPSGMGLKTGFNVSKVRNSFSFSSNEDSNPDSTSVGNKITNTNIYTYVDIPLLFSYEMAGYGPFYYNINAGLLFNMIFTAEGKFITPNGSISSFTRGDLDRYQAYETSAGTALYASFGAHYVINKVFDFVIEPNITYSMGPATLKDYPVKEKYTKIGLITGIRYKF